MPGDFSMYTLSPRLACVAQGLIDGKSDKEIANVMEISTDGVGHHVKRVFDLLGVRNRTAAAVKLVTAGVKCA